MNCLLSIIIPTKNRYSTLFPVLDYLKTVKGEDFEIIVQDNSDDNTKALEFLKKSNNEKIKYYYSNEQFSQTGNSDNAVKNASGKYICFIGDDDGVMPYILRVVKWMSSNQIEAIKSYKPFYQWPGLPVSLLDKSIINGSIKGGKFNYNIREINCEKGLLNLLKKGGTDVSLIPCLYHGIVSKKILDKIYLKTGSFFPGPSPDMANAVSVSLEIDSFYYLDFPLIISGRSVHSIGGQGVLHNHIAQIKDVPHLPKNTVDEWTNKIPKYWTGETIWAESALKALKKYNKLEFVNKFNYNYLYARIVLFNPGIRKIIFSNFPYQVYTFNFLLSFTKQLIVRVGLIIKDRLFGKKSLFQDNLKDIGTAIAYIDKNVDQNKIFKTLNEFSVENTKN